MHKELAKFAVYGADGHFHAAASRDRKLGGKAQAVGHFFALNLIAFLYKMRWDIEKVFDETKNKFNERKAWASSLRAKTQQGLFLCMAHNLMLLLERTLEREEGIVDEKCCRKRAKRMQLIEEKLKERGDMLNPLVSGLFRVTQRSLQFIRWLRIQLRSPTPWPEAVDVLRPLMKAYL